MLNSSLVSSLTGKYYFFNQNQNFLLVIFCQPDTDGQFLIAHKELLNLAYLTEWWNPSAFHHENSPVKFKAEHESTADRQLLTSQKELLSITSFTEWQIPSAFHHENSLVKFKAEYESTKKLCWVKCITKYWWHQEQ